VAIKKLDKIDKEKNIKEDFESLFEEILNKIKKEKQ